MPKRNIAALNFEKETIKLLSYASDALGKATTGTL